VSGWQLGLVLFGCWLAGVGCGVTAVALYARHVWRSRLGLLAGQLTGAQLVTTSSGYGHVEPPPLDEGGSFR
jgi:hypothetical protein